MGKVKITRPEAYSKFKDEIDFEVMDQETESLFSQAKGFGKEQSSQFFYLAAHDLVLLEIYWDDEKVYELSFG